MATRDIVPRATGEGSLGTSDKYWGSLYANNLYGDISFLHTGTGAVARTLNSRLSEIVSVKDFGAQGDASNDDLSAIQAAHDSLSASGGTIFFPIGTYNIAGTINITKGVRIIGASADGATISQQTASTVTLAIATTSPCRVETIRLMNSAGGTGIRVRGTLTTNYNFGSVFDNVTIGDGAYGIDFSRAAGWSLANSYIASTTTAAVLVENTSSVTQDVGDSNINGNIIDLTGGSGGAILQRGSGGLRIQNNKILGGTTGNGVWVSPTAGVATSILLIVGNSIEVCDYGIVYETGGGGALGSIVIANNQFAAAATAHITIASSNAGSIVIAGNVLTDGPATYIALTTLDGAIVHGNIFIGAGDAITVGAGATNVHIGANQYYGITRTIVTGNSTLVVTGGPPTIGTALPTVADGSTFYCSDCTADASCTGGGTGAFAKRINGAWVCN